jgi:hypothetical protein
MHPRPIRIACGDFSAIGEPVRAECGYTVAVRELIREASIADWGRFHPRAALRCIVAMAVALGAGIASGHPGQGLMATAGAFSVGFGSFQELRGSRKAPMLLAALGICLSSWIGTVAGGSSIATIVVTGTWATMYAAVSFIAPGASWVGIQCVIWLVISSGFPATGLQAFTRGSMALAGGLLQMLFVLASWHWEGAITPAPAPQAVAEQPLVSGLKQLFHGHYDDRLYLGQAATTMIAASAFARWLALPNSYWIGVTALLVMRPDLHQATLRGVSRIIGTLVGAALSTLIASGLRPGPHMLLALVLIFAWFCYALIYVNYALFAVCITAYVVFLLAVGGLPEKTVIAKRALNTVIGGSLALLVHVPFAFFASKRERERPSHAPDGA